MRTLEKIKRDVLSKQELDFIVARARRLLLLELLPEVGYDAVHFAKHKYSVGELKDRLVTQIRELRQVVGDLVREKEALRCEKERQAQVLFEFVSGEKDGIELK